MNFYRVYYVTEFQPLETTETIKSIGFIVYHAENEVMVKKACKDWLFPNTYTIRKVIKIKRAFYGAIRKDYLCSDSSPVKKYYTTMPAGSLS